MNFALLVVVCAAHAAVNTCIGADGKVTISDLPCEQVLSSSQNRSGGSRNQAELQARDKHTAQTESDSKDTLQMTDGLEVRILAAHTTECRALRQELNKQGQIKEGVVQMLPPSSAKNNPVWRKYDVDCASRAKDIAVLYNAQAEHAKNEAMRKTSCRNKAIEYQQLQNNTATLTVKQSEVLSNLTVELARGCR